MENGQHNTSLVVSVLTSTTDEITISKVEYLKSPLTGKREGILKIKINFILHFKV
jgi:hypothetical protein